MKFRPCIDIHNGKVKQIVGSSLADAGDFARENFVSQKSAAEYAALFAADGLKGGHMILLNSRNSEYYEADCAQAEAAFSAYPGGLQIGGGITSDNAESWIRKGASHVIVTSYVFRDGMIDMERLKALTAAVGPKHLVLDLSAKPLPEDMAGHAEKPFSEERPPYYVMTDRWQRYTDTVLDTDLLTKLSAYCGEFLIHGIATEGLGHGFDERLVRLLAEAAPSLDVPITYAGGIRSMADVEAFRTLSGGLLDYTVGSALDLYGGTLEYKLLKRS